MVDDERYWDRRMETISQDELRVVQNFRIQWQIRRCWERSEFYRARLRSAGAGPEDIRGLDDLRRVPVLTDGELARIRQSRDTSGVVVAPPDSWREAAADTQQPSLPPWGIWTEADLVHRTSLAARALWGFGVRPGDTVVADLSEQWGLLRRAIEDGAGKIGAGLARGIHLEQGKRGFVVREMRRTSREPTDQVTADIASTSWIVSRVDADTGESRSDSGLRAYGHVTLGPTLAAECGHRSGLHWAEDHFLVEILDPESLRPLAAGRTGAVVVTHLTREGTPVIRYRTPLVAALETSPCGCGRTHARSLAPSFEVVASGSPPGPVWG